MGRTPAPIVVHRLTPAEQRVLSSFLSGRLPAGQLDAQLARARQPLPVAAPQPAPPLAQPATAPAVAA
jgi:hypothetical protein